MSPWLPAPLSLPFIAPVQPAMFGPLRRRLSTWVCTAARSCRLFPVQDPHVLTSDCSCAIQAHGGPCVVPWAAGALSCNLRPHSKRPVQVYVAVQGFPPQWIHSTVERKEQPALAGAFEGFKATKIEPSAAQPPISAPSAENKGDARPPHAASASHQPQQGPVPQGWNQALGVRCPA